MDNKPIKNKAIKRQPIKHGVLSKGMDEFTIVKDSNGLIEGDTVYLTPEMQKIYKSKGLIK